jgi:outer membrane murein-binding lipoprotein Lpp
MLKKLLLIPIILLAGCSSEPTYSYDVESVIFELEDTIEEMQSRIDDLESQVEDLEYKQTDLEDEVFYLRSELEDTVSSSYPSESVKADDYSFEEPISRQEPVKTEAVTPDNPPNYFTLGSSKDHVKKIMGTPDSIVLTSWWYGKQSWVSFDKNELVEGWYNGGNNLKIK